MTWQRRSWLLALGALAFAQEPPHSTDGYRSPTAQPVADGHALSTKLSALPLRFEPNRGQFDQPIRFLARGPDFDLYLTPDGATLSLPAHSSDLPGHRGHAAAQPAAAVTMHLVGGRRDIEPVAAELLSGTTNYFVGRDRSRWRTGIEGYARVHYAGVLPGVDVVYYGTSQRRLEYDLVLAPGVDPQRVRIAFDGAAAVRMAGDGAVAIQLPNGAEIVQPRPVAYQVDGTGLRRSVDVRYEARDGAIALAPGAFDAERELVVDPGIVYSTYLGGGTGVDEAAGIAVDSAGEILLTGTTQSVDFPTASSFQALLHTPRGSNGFNAFVTKLNATGSALVYSTYLGGSTNDQVAGIAVDGAGEAVVAGYTESSDFPTASAFQGSLAGPTNAFVTKLSASGSALVYSTYVGGATYDRATSVAVDPAGEALITGYTRSSDFPVDAPFQSAFVGSQSAFVAKFGAQGAVVYATYLGGSVSDEGTGIATDSAGDAFVTGVTASLDFPTASPLQACGGDDGFVTELDPAGLNLVYSTCLHGSGFVQPIGIAVDGAGEAFVTGFTAAPDFPTVSAYDASKPGPVGGFVTKIAALGTGLVYSTYLGSNFKTFPNAIAIDSAGEAYVVGSTSGIDFPIVSPISSASSGFFLTKFSADGTALVYSTFLGVIAPAIAVDGAGEAFVAGSAPAGLTTVAPFQAAAAGNGDAFIERIAEIGLVLGPSQSTPPTVISGDATVPYFAPPTLALTTSGYQVSGMGIGVNAGDMGLTSTIVWTSSQTFSLPTPASVGLSLVGDTTITAGGGLGNYEITGAIDGEQVVTTGSALSWGGPGIHPVSWNVPFPKTVDLAAGTHVVTMTGTFGWNPGGVMGDVGGSVTVDSVYNVDRTIIVPAPSPALPKSLAVLLCGVLCAAGAFVARRARLHARSPVE